ncbi:MAG: SRPBCC family protein [Leptospiraceae bacterium]|nr:SRPBCC family protein [Leptospiraceae bacterium]
MKTVLKKQKLLQAASLQHGLVWILAQAVLLLWTASCSQAVHLEKTILINAPVSRVYDYINQIRNGKEWDPWSAADPTMQTNYGPIDSGVGASYSWTSENSGSGKAVITSAIVNERIETALDFGKMGSATASMQLKAEAGQTRLTWGFDSEVPIFFVSKVKTDVGQNYEQGLANLKKILESSAPGH